MNNPAMCVFRNLDAVAQNAKILNFICDFDVFRIFSIGHHVFHFYDKNPMLSGFSDEYMVAHLNKSNVFV